MTKRSATSPRICCRVAGASPVVVPAVSSGLSVVSFAELLASEVFVVNFGGTLHRIIPAP